LLSLIFLVAYDWPIATKTLDAVQANSDAAKIFKQFFNVGMYFAAGMIVLFMVYPAITLLVMFLPSTSRAFSAVGGGGDSSGRYDRDEPPDYDDRRDPVDYDDRRDRPGDEGFKPR
jgi:hypothetical protein